MRILLVGETFYPEFVGGIERRNTDLAAALARRGHEVTLAAFGSSDPPSGVRALPLGPRRSVYRRSGTRSLAPALSLALAVSRLSLRGYDVVETSAIPFAHLFPLAARCAAGGRPLVVDWYEYWGPYWNDYAGPWLGPICRAVERVAARVGFPVASSALTASRLARRRGGPPPPVVPCGTDVEEIASATEGIEPEPGRLIYAGRLLSHKRLDLLLDALALLPTARLVVYGAGPEKDRLVEQVRRLGLGARVELRAPAADRAEVWREIRRSVLAVLPSVREGFGIFPLEAMAAGVPVVCVRSALNAVPELVRPGIEGVCAEPAADSLARAIARLLGDGGREAMGERARRRAAEYGADAAAAAMEAVYAAFAGGRNPAGPR